MISGTAVSGQGIWAACIHQHKLLCGAEDVLVCSARVMLNALEEYCGCVVSVSHMTIGYSLSKHVVSHFNESHF